MIGGGRCKRIAVSIELHNVSKKFGDYTALNDVSFSVADGELVALLGPSGSGKTTLLRIIAGLEAADAGEILFHGRQAAQRSVRDRRVGFVFQHYALFRHMTVFENVAFGLRVRPRRQRPSRALIREKVMSLLNLVQIDMLSERYPSQLSGGQRQRVALARALALEPEVLLLDEPFGALDARVRRELRRWLRRLHDELHMTSVFVTHDQEEALDLADRVAVLNRGRIEQIGTPDHVYNSPANPFVYNFLGSVNLFHGRIDKGMARIGDLSLAIPQHADTHDTPAVGCVRPHDIELERCAVPGTAFEAVVQHIHPVGPTVKLALKRQDTGELIEAELSRDRYHELAPHVGEKIHIRPRNLQVFIQDYSI